jgi:hypothetical protein
MSDVESPFFGVTHNQIRFEFVETTNAFQTGGPRAGRAANGGSPRTCRVRVAERRRRARECVPASARATDDCRNNNPPIFFVSFAKAPSSPTGNGHM